MCAVLKLMIGSHESLMGKGGVKSYIHVERYRCPKCKTIHRFLPECVHPYKQYDAEIIDGVIEGADRF